MLTPNETLGHVMAGLVLGALMGALFLLGWWCGWWTPQDFNSATAAAHRRHTGHSTGLHAEKN